MLLPLLQGIAQKCFEPIGVYAVMPHPLASVPQRNSHTKISGLADLVCEQCADSENLAKTESNLDNAKPLGMKAKSNQKNPAKTGFRNLSLISTN